MSVLVFYGGAGINILSYCCNECSMVGVEAMKKEKCFVVHNQDKNHNYDALCSSRQEHKNNNCCESKHQKPEDYDDSKSLSYCHNIDSNDFCSVERFIFDWTVQSSSEHEIDLSPQALDVLPYNLFDISYIHLPVTCNNNTVMSNGPPSVYPREYLSIITVLLI